MKTNKPVLRKDVAFINRQKELAFLGEYIGEKPESILFLHGPKSSGKTTLLYKFLEQAGKKQDLDIKFLNLRETLTNVYEDFLKAFFNVQGEGEKKGIQPVLVIDELQALDKVYIDNDKERQLIIALFNFFVAMTKERHLAHIIIASSDGYFLNTVYTDSRLKKAAKFYKVDYLCKEDVMDWLLNLEKYSKIKAYRLTKEDVEKIWDAVGGSMWEIQDILSYLFQAPLEEVLASYIKRIRSLIVTYMVKSEKNELERLLRRFIDSDELPQEEIGPVEEKLLSDMVRQNILYFDPTEAKYYPQGKSYQNGIRAYFKKD
ncbi:MAG: ATP-binding protein [Candidatus Aminicenantes bacterium]|nr:ATP-binding protein [Candidatus Aminicenantes bacterium]